MPLITNGRITSISHTLKPLGDGTYQKAIAGPVYYETQKIGADKKQRWPIKPLAWRVLCARPVAHRSTPLKAMHFKSVHFKSVLNKLPFPKQLIHKHIFRSSSIKPLHTRALRCKPLPVSTRESEHCLPDKTELNAVETHKSGMPLSHMLRLVELAVSMNVVFGFRPIDRLNTELILQNLPAKPLSIKAKSADWGPMAGFICVNQTLSKLVHANNPELIKHFEARTQSCLREGQALPGALTITNERLQALCECRDRHLMKFNEPVLQVETQVGDQWQRFHFHLSPSSEGHWLVEYQNSPVLVLCHPQSGLPIIADYDLMMVAPDIRDFDYRDTPIKPEISFFAHKNKVVKYDALWSRLFSHDQRLTISDTQLLVDAFLKEAFVEGLDPRLGNLTPRERSVILRINQALNRPNGCELVQHGTEALNPFATPRDAKNSNYPAIFFIPYRLTESGQRVNQGRCDLIENTASMKALIQELKDQGYVANANPAWEDELQNIRRTQFRESKRALGLNKAMNKLMV